MGDERALRKVSAGGWTIVPRRRLMLPLAAVLLVACQVLAGCSNFTMPSEEPPTAGVDPSYGMLIAKRLKTTFKPMPPLNTFEISNLRWVHTMAGWSWIVCLHFQDRGYQRSYVMLLKGTDITDARYAVRTDDCELQTYTPFNLDTGALGTTGVDTQGPIY